MAPQEALGVHSVMLVLVLPIRQEVLGGRSVVVVSLDILLASRRWLDLHAPTLDPWLVGSEALHELPGSLFL